MASTLMAHFSSRKRSTPEATSSSSSSYPFPSTLFSLLPDTHKNSKNKNSDLLSSPPSSSSSSSSVPSLWSSSWLTEQHQHQHLQPPIKEDEEQEEQQEEQDEADNTEPYSTKKMKKPKKPKKPKRNQKSKHGWNKDEAEQGKEEPHESRRRPPPPPSMPPPLPPPPTLLPSPPPRRQNNRVEGAFRKDHSNDDRNGNDDDFCIYLREEILQIKDVNDDTEGQQPCHGSYYHGKDPLSSTTHSQSQWGKTLSSSSSSSSSSSRLAPSKPETTTLGGLYGWGSSSSSSTFGTTAHNHNYNNRRPFWFPSSSSLLSWQTPPTTTTTTTPTAAHSARNTTTSTSTTTTTSTSTTTSSITQPTEPDAAPPCSSPKKWRCNPATTTTAGTWWWWSHPNPNPGNVKPLSTAPPPPATTTRRNRGTTTTTTMTTTTTTSPSTQQCWIRTVSIFLGCLLLVYPLLVVVHQKQLWWHNDNDDNNEDGSGPPYDDFEVTTIHPKPNQVLHCNVDLQGADLALLDLSSSSSSSPGTAAVYSLSLSYSAPNTLCLLGQTDQAPNKSKKNNNNNLWIPVARSFDGQPWQWYSNNPFPSQPMKAKAAIVCNDDTKTCTVPLLLSEEMSVSSNFNPLVVKLPPPHVAQDKDSMIPHRSHHNLRRQTTRQTTTTITNTMPSKAPQHGQDDPLAPRPRRLPQSNHHVPLSFALAHRSSTTLDTTVHGVQDEMARFLEQTTFGTTRAELQPLVQQQQHLSQISGDGGGAKDTTTTTTVMAQWLWSQMNDIRPTLHRVVWRRYANSRFEQSSPTGRVTRACQAQAAYRSFALTETHHDKLLQWERRGGGGAESSFLLVLRLDQVVLTVLSNNHNDPVTVVNEPEVVFPDSGSYKICKAPQAYIGGEIWLYHPTLESCRGPIQFGTVVGNPPVTFDGVTDSNVDLLPSLLLQLGETDVDPLDGEYFATKEPTTTQRIITKNALSDSLCSQMQEQKRGGPIPVVFAQYKAHYWIHDARFVLQDNTLVNPLKDGGGALVKETTSDKFYYQAMCSNVPRSWQNEATCQLSQDAHVCGPSLSTRNQPLEITLDASTIRLFYSLTNSDTTGGQGGARYVYAVEGLRLQDDNEAPSPCQPLARSRWVATASSSTESACLSSSSSSAPPQQRQTLTVLSNLIANHGDGTDLMRDVFFPARPESSDAATATTCHANDLAAKGFAVFANGTCWKQVHPNHHQVYDFTTWLNLHPGGRDKIAQWAEEEPSSPFLYFPNSHDMQRWQLHSSLFPNLGRYGETIQFQDLSTELQTSPSILSYFFPSSSSSMSSSSSSQSGGAIVPSTVVCGSPGEVANDLTLGGELERGAFGVYTDYNNTAGNFHEDKEMVWLTIALTAPDQLRQRVAWALSQILVVNADSNGGSRTEAFVNFYDIFVRHAFGSYRDVLKEVSYSSLMAVMLTYLDSKSTGYNWLRNVGVLEHPDENYAREIMQLFTIGLYELNDDGTQVLDTNGLPIQTYSNNDIMEYARVWTGMRQQDGRGNIDNAFSNRVDPMKIYVPYRDVFPKMGLNQEYIGDGYPLCADLPKYHFLKKGAKYILLGSNPMPELQPDNPWDEQAIRFKAEPLGQLHITLCGSSDSSSCTYPGVVILPQTLNCVGVECDVDTIRVVQVHGGIYYEYVPPPCVYHSFVENPRKIKRRKRGNGEGVDAYMCADPNTAVASTACCYDGSRANVYETYWGEQVLASTAQARCSDPATSDGTMDLALCSSPEKLSINNCVGNMCGGPYYPFYWFGADAPCQIKVKIDSRNREIAVVHSVPDEDPTQSRERRFEEEDNPTFFRAQFYSDDLSINCPTNPECTYAEDGYCMCNVIVTNEQVFDAPPSTKDEVLSLLSIGAFSPDLWDVTYTTAKSGEVTVYNPGTEASYSTETVFEVKDSFGVTQLRKNVHSVVRIGATSITFRNPVHFVSLAEPTLRDARYETDAALDQYLYHKNTAPFLAVRFAQRFGISNPSPALIKSVAQAFRSGNYVYQNAGFTSIFGKGSYGDLAATVAALLLDPEVRSPVLDADPVSGSLKEPLLKVTGLMRNLEFRPTPQYPFARFRVDLQDTIGQMVYQSPGIFSFFFPEFQPNGLLANAGLVSPEAQVLSAPNIIQTMNGLLTMIKYGLDRCYSGFGYTVDYISYRECKWRTPGQYVNASSYPDFTPTTSASAQMVDELATIMTSGRLNNKLREIITNIVLQERDPVHAAVQAQQLIVSTSEFHSTGTVRKRGEGRAKRPPVVQARKPYKAVVVLMLDGGYDSYNLVVPHTCSGTNDLGLTVLEQYMAERGEIALKVSERNLVIDVPGQPCEKFAIHDAMPIVQKLYNDGDLSLFLNTGVINKPATKDTYEAVTATQLFAHNTMQKEAQQIDPFNEVVRTGILGRLSQILNSETYGYNAQGISINTFAPAVNVDDPSAPAPMVLNENGPAKFNDKPSSEAFEPYEGFELLNGANHVSSSLFGEYWSESFMHALGENEFLTGALNNVSLPHDCGPRRLRTIVQLMETRKDRGAERDLFFVGYGGWDHHSNLKSSLKSEFEALNEGLTCYVDNLKELGLWDQVTLLVVSEFGRTLTGNTNKGSDHGWAGHYFALGGGLNGGQSFGQYPSDLTQDGPLNVGRGRIMPTLSWESIWMPVCEWLGVSTNHCAEFVLPNSQRTGSTMLSVDDVFKLE
ncbi:hypothetical protein ACA910_011983 [Epithemia clementina (nom. ined.)]